MSMIRLYHITKPENLENILKEGLIPQKTKGVSTDLDLEVLGRHGVYLTTDFDLILSIDCSFSERGYSILTVDVDRNNLVRDDAYDMVDVEEVGEQLISWIHADPIPPESIEVLETFHIRKL